MAGTNGGGAIDNFGPTTITQSTFSGNSAPYDSNLLNYTGFTLSISMSIVANGQGAPNCGGGAAFTDAGYNLDTGSSCGFSSANHSMNNTDPQLGPLANNGGPTQTMALPPGARPRRHPVEHARCTGSTDQRGITGRRAPAVTSAHTNWSRRLGAAVDTDGPDRDRRHIELGVAVMERVFGRNRLHRVPQRHVNRHHGRS